MSSGPARLRLRWARGVNRHLSSSGGAGYGPAIGCIVALLALLSPRLAIFVLWLFSDVLDRAYDDWIVPVLGFFLLPWTTLAYAVMWSAGRNGVEGFEWFIVVLAFLFDLGAIFSGGRERRG